MSIIKKRLHPFSPQKNDADAVDCKPASGQTCNQVFPYDLGYIIPLLVPRRGCAGIYPAPPGGRGETSLDVLFLKELFSPQTGQSQQTDAHEHQARGFGYDLEVAGEI